MLRQHSNENNFNFLEDDYNNPEFNRYASGPGAELPETLQKPESSKNFAAAGRRKNHRYPYLVIRIPKTMTQNALLNLCERVGKVQTIRYNAQSNLYFVDFAKMA